MNATIHSTEALLAQVSWLNALALELVQDRGEAEDLAQETILRALEHPPRAAGAMRGFLRRVSRNILLDRARADNRRRDREERAAREEAVSPTDDVVDRLATHRRLVDAIGELAEPYRATILLRYFDGLAPREIAQAQNAPVKTVNTRLHRAIDQLRAELDERSNGDRRQWAILLLPFVEAAPSSAPATKASVKPLAIAAVTVATIVVGVIAWRSAIPQTSLPPAEAVAQLVNDVKSAAAALEEPRRALAREAIGANASKTSSPKVSGRVIGIDGMPIARATVTAFLRPSAGFQERTGEFSKSKTQIAQGTATDDGRFAIDVTGDASYRLEAQASGLGTEIQEDVFSGEEVVLTMKRAGRFAFKVLHDESDEPCANAVLRLGRTGIVGSIFEGETDYGGRASVGDLAPGIYLVEVTPRDAERVFTIDLVLQAGEKLEHELRAKPGQTVRGIVRSSIDRAPIAGARVIHRPDRVATTDGAGRFEIRGLPSGQTRVTLDVDANGFAPSSSKLDPKSTEPVEVSLAPEARVSGRLVDASAAPVPSAWVIIDEREARTDSNGAFVVRGLAAKESATCFVRAVGNATLAAVAPKAIAPGENDWGTIALERPAHVSGRVLTQDGKPVAGAIVTLKAGGALEQMRLAPTVMDDVVLDDDTTGVEDTSVVVGVGAVGSLLQPTDFFGQPRTDAGPLRDRTARTVATGRFSMFDLPSGRYLITARGQGHAQTAPIEVEVSAGQLRDDIEFRFATGSSIQGRVLSMDGAPIAGAWIVLLDPEETNWSGRVGVNSLSGLDGGFSLEGLSARRYDLEVSFHGIAAGHAYATTRVPDLVPPIRDLDVQLRPLAFVEGALVDDAGRPLEQLWVRATDTEGRRESAQTDERGRFRVGVIEGRTARLTVFPATPNMPLLWDAELSDVAAGTTHVVLRASRKK